METYRRRWEAFGWQALIVDGHDIPALLDAYRQAERITDQPSVVLARTIKGKGMLEVEDKEGEHGKAMKPELADKIIAVLEQQLKQHPSVAWRSKLLDGAGQYAESWLQQVSSVLPLYKPGSKDVATR